MHVRSENKLNNVKNKNKNACDANALDSPPIPTEMKTLGVTLENLRKVHNSLIRPFVCFVFFDKAYFSSFKHSRLTNELENGREIDFECVRQERLSNSP